VPVILVLGYGNPLRRDDGAGWHVAEAIADRWDGQITLRLGQQLVPEWAADLAEADLTFFVDASARARRVVLRRLAPASDNTLVDGHGFGPDQLLRVVEVVYARRPDAYVVEIPAVDFGMGEGLSATAKAGVIDAIRLLDRRLALAVNHAQPEAQPAI
jgi:hydrogenase maturation protease